MDCFTSIRLAKADVCDRLSRDVAASNISGSKLALQSRPLPLLVRVRFFTFSPRALASSFRALRSALRRFFSSLSSRSRSSCSCNHCFSKKRGLLNLSLQGPPFPSFCSSSNIASTAAKFGGACICFGSANRSFNGTGRVSSVNRKRVALEFSSVLRSTVILSKLNNWSTESADT